MFALLRFHFKVDPETLPEQKIIELFAQLEWARQEEAKYNLSKMM